MKAPTSLTAERVRELLNYDPLTGAFTWRAKRSEWAGPGDAVGHRMRIGYIQIGIDRGSYLAHRLVWLFVHGAWPRHEVDHINGNRADNRLANLRDVPKTSNQQNRRHPNRDSESGLLGVHRNRNRWVAELDAHGVRHVFGRFKTKEEAHRAYWEGKRRLHDVVTIQPASARGNTSLSETDGVNHG